MPTKTNDAANRAFGAYYMAKNNNPFDPAFNNPNWSPSERQQRYLQSMDAQQRLTEAQARRDRYGKFDQYYGSDPGPTVKVARNENRHSHQITMEVADHMMERMTNEFLGHAVRDLCNRAVQQMAPDLEKQFLAQMVQTATPIIQSAVQSMTADPTWMRRVMQECVSQVLKETVLAVRKQMQEEAV